MLYTFKAGLVDREKDNFENGCDYSSSITQFFGCELDDVILCSNTLNGLVKKIQDYFNVSNDAILLNSCEEMGRLDVQTYTKGFHSIKCSYKQHEKGFKAGDYDLYLNNIIGYVKLEQDLDLKSILAEELKGEM